MQSSSAATPSSLSASTLAQTGPYVAGDAIRLHLIIWRNCRVTILLMREQVTLVHHRSNFVNTSVKHCLACGPDVKRKVSPATGSRARTDYLFSPTRRTNSWKRGSLRSGSYVGSTLRAVRLLERSAAAFSNHPKALSLSPIPT